MPPTRNGADVLLQQLEDQGVDCIFASPIAVMAPIWESLARGGDAHGSRHFRCRHELLAIGLAAGYYKATGRSQVVFLPSSLGVQNGSMGLHTALQERIPMTVLSPDTLSYGEDPAVDPGPEWPSLLVDLVGPAHTAPVPERAERWAAHSAAVRARGRHAALEARSEAKDFVPAADVFSALHDALPDDAICVDEIVAQVPQMLQFLYERKSLTQYRGWAGALGMSLGTALGAKLAAPERIVVTIVGDGAWHYNPVSAALGFAQEYGLPLLIVLCNNEQYASQTWNVLRYYPDSEAVRDHNFVGDVISPTPDYVKVVEAYGGLGQRVRTADELGPALQRALQTVAAGRTFLLDVIVKP